MTNQLTQTDFAQNVKTSFQITDARGSAIDVVLEDVTPRKLSARQEQFSVYFRGPLDSFLQQGTYRLEHSHIGSMELFLVPVGKNETGYSYEAVFNRFISVPESTERSLAL